MHFHPARRRRAIAGAIAAVIAATVLTSCSAPAAPAAEKQKVTPTAMPTPTPTPTPTPELLTTEEAADYYLDTVCPANALLNPYANAYNALVAAGAGGDIAPVVGSAVALRDGTQAAAVRLIDPMVIWPETVAADAVIISNAYFARIVEYNSVALSATYDEVMGVTAYVDAPEVAAAGPRIRSLLGLSTDTVASCTGHQ